MRGQIIEMSVESVEHGHPLLLNQPQRLSSFEGFGENHPGSGLQEHQGAFI